MVQRLGPRARPCRRLGNAEDGIFPLNRDTLCRSQLTVSVSHLASHLFRLGERGVSAPGEFELQVILEVGQFFSTNRDTSRNAPARCNGARAAA
jgi:hypothetical protein